MLMWARRLEALPFMLELVEQGSFKPDLSDDYAHTFFDDQAGTGKDSWSETHKKGRKMQTRHTAVVGDQIKFILRKCHQLKCGNQLELND